MKDVAREAGVALGTVSKVFNGIAVGKAYRDRVEAAAAQLGYSVDNYARGLRSGRTSTVAMIVPGLDHSFFSSLANAVSYELLQRDYRLMLVTTQFDPHAESRCVQMVRQNKVDGIIGLTYTSDLRISGDLPYVSIDRCISPNIPCVSSDNFSGGSMAAEKLISLGCTKLLFLRTGSRVIGETDKRGAGFTAACELAGTESFSLRVNDEDGIEAIYAFLDDHIRNGRLEYDGIFCNTDRLAFFVRRYLEQRGIRVPEDVQMIGYDGTRHFFTGDYVCSTIVQPVQQMAETAVRILLNEEQYRLSALVCLPVSYAAGGTTREPAEKGEGLINYGK
ncbi:MAG: LacI family DNA-binding transcriptional regulator [Clostridia bacterium]|nr:LacI family DNA-binding transcriptional regulator [Clostridia bacterium]